MTKKRDAATSPQMPRAAAAGRSNGGLLAAPAAAHPLPTPRSTPKRERDTTADCSTSPPPPAPPPPLSVIGPRGSLEKCRTLGDQRPVRQLRTTRSLSPRPPICRQQQAVVVLCEDELLMQDGDVGDDEVFVPVAASPAGPRRSHTGPRGKAHSEHASPHLSSLTAAAAVMPTINGPLPLTAGGHRWADNNRSTGCLMYVPSDPWVVQPTPRSPAQLAAPASPAVADPWIHQARASTLQRCDRSTSTTTAARSSAAYAQQHASMHSLLPAVASSTANSNETPPGTAAAAAQHLLLSVASAGASSKFLSATGGGHANALLPRHSFSTLLPPRAGNGGDEQPLSIRRLSEQIHGQSERYLSATQHRRQPNGLSYDFSASIAMPQQQRGGGGGGKCGRTAADVAAAGTPGKSASASSVVAAVLETTC